MNTRNVSRGMMSKLQRILLTVAVFIVLFGSLPVDKAFAWSYLLPSGRPGAVSIPRVYISDLPAGANILYPTFYNSSTSSGPIVYRSPATSGDQFVSGTYALQFLNGSDWVTIAYAVNSPFSGWIRAGQNSIVFPNLYIQPYPIQAGYYRVTWVFAWKTGAGVVLGSTAVVSNLATDHVCYKTTIPCRSYAGSVRLK